MTLRSIFPVAAVAVLCSAASPAFAGDGGTETQPAISIAIAELDYSDTSGEANDQTAAHRRRLDAFGDALRRDLAASGRFRVEPLSCGTAPCSSASALLAIQQAAREAGAKLVVIGGIHKMSTLVQWGKFQIVDEDSGRIVLDRLVTFRGDSDEAWSRAEAFVAGEILELPAKPGVAGTPPIRLAVFEFELEDFSGGAGIIPESPDDIEQLKRATETARRLITQSGAYTLVDPSGATADPVKQHALRQCDGCDAAIALKLGADQSLVGIVTRISRTDYAVSYRLRDAHSGAVIAVAQTDLRIGANYSWDRGAAWLIRHRLLEKAAQE
ncbi:DUF2380 domain-containing protein [Bradyrhizobium sp.]|uniref:DUF3280 domain-containing protein n=1 Tax=Bradyrhizobium sp. TaxID=376 RepID=UPI003C32B31E